MDASNETTDFQNLKPKQCVGFRHVQVLLLFLAMLLSYAMRVNMSMAIVAMTDAHEPKSFNWGVKSKSVVLSSFFWGYVMLQMVGGQVARRVGGKWPILMLISVNALLSFLIPVSAQYGGWQAVCACRVIQGLSQGFLFPCMHHLLGKWIPLDEKSRLITLVYAGSPLGNAFQFLISGFIADVWGWQAIFYTNGILGSVWALFYLVLGSDSPQTSRFIGKEEKLYIQTSLGHIGGHKKLPVPWKSVLTSVPFWALLVTQSGQSWGYFTLLTLIPSYMGKVHNVDLKSNGVLSALPHLVMYLASFPFGYVSDLVLRRKWLSVTATRKICNSIGFWSPAVFLVMLSYAPAGDVPLAVAALTLGVGFNAGHLCGYLLVHIDMSHNFAGTLMGITNTAAMTLSIVAPIAAGQMLHDERRPEEWRRVFLVASAIYFFTNLVFVMFTSSARQPWDHPAEEEEDEDVTDEIKETLEQGTAW